MTYESTSIISLFKNNVYDIIDTYYIRVIIKVGDEG